MSNMIHSGYTYYNHGDKLVINSDDKEGAFVPIYFKNSERILLDTPEDLDLQSEEDGEELEEDTLLLNERAEEILAKARADAEKILIEASVQGKMKKDIILEEARQSGYAEGYLKGEAGLKALEKQLKEQIEKNQIEYRSKVMQLEPMFAELTIQMVEKLTGAVVKSKKDVVLHLMEKALLNNEGNSQNYIIHVSKEDFMAVETKKKQLHAILKAGASLEIIEDIGLKKNQCLIETDSKMIDCSLDVQLENLKENLRELSGA